MERVGDNVYASTDVAVHRFNVATGAFEKDSLLTAVMAPYKGSWVNEIAEGRDNKLWMTLYHNYQSHTFYRQKGKLTKLPLSGRFSDALITKIHDTRQGFLLFGSNKWIVLMDENKPVLKSKPFKTLIRQVSINKDSLVAFRDDNTRTNIQYGLEGLRFRFALPSYDLSGKNEFQYFLEGYSDYWSNWSAEPFVDFTNLPEGHYVFKVRGKNIYGEIGSEDSFTFNILPPWYRTWWANAAYVILLISLTVLTIRFRERALQREKLVLENTVRERTEKITVQTEELKEMDRMKSRFFANISHEFRTPLTLILTPLEEELKKKPPAEREGLLVMKRYANRLVELVNQLLNLSKLDAGKMELQVQETDLRQFLSIISSSFDSLAQHKDIAFKRQLSISNESSWFDPDKLEKILTNLLSNAFKFTPAGGAVTLTAINEREKDKEFLFIDLTDTGKGIPPEEQKRVFESFYQTRQTVENYEGGTGLGLALVKELVKLHNGSIQLQSEVDSGTTFSVKIPIGKSAYQENQHIQPANDALAWQTSLTKAESVTLPEPHQKALEIPNTEHRDSVLVVEDNPELRRYICKLLEEEYLVYNAPEGIAAFETAVRVIPNLIVSDVMMPGMDGMELTAKIKSDERTSHIPVILLTAKSAQESRIEGLKTGADDYLTKPFSIEELHVRAKNLIQSRKRLAERFRERILVQVTPSHEVSLDDKFLLKAKNIVEANMEDVLFSVEKMAEEMSLSRTQLLRKLKALTALAPNDFIRDMRLQKAAEMIRKKADTITQIGYAVGFNDQSYFSKCFKKEFGETPTEFSTRVSHKQV